MTNAELMTNSQRCEALSPDRCDSADKGCAKVERVVLNALEETAALPPDICAFGAQAAIVSRHGESSIGAVTDAKQRPGLPADPPSARRLYPLATAGVKILVGRCFRLLHLVIPSSSDIRHFPATCLPRTMGA